MTDSRIRRGIMDDFRRSYMEPLVVISDVDTMHPSNNEALDIWLVRAPIQPQLDANRGGRAGHSCLENVMC